MTASNFKRCFALVLKEEGGNSDDPHDKGGRTSRGITQGEWNIYRQSHSGLPSDVWKAPQSAVNDIYKTQYWNPYCDDLPSGIDLLFFNASVNSGRQQAVKEMQRALGVTADGMMGNETRAAVNAPQDYRILIHNMSEQRRAFYRRLKTFKYFGAGWMARTKRMEISATGMAQPFKADAAIATASDAAATTPSSQRATPDDLSTPPVSIETAAGGTGLSTITSGAADQLQNISNTISPLQDTMHWVKIVAVILAIACAGLAIYAVIERKKNEAVS